MANRNFQNKLYSFNKYPVLLSLSFVVDNTAPAGVLSVAGRGVKSVFMNSSAPSAENPNPAAGVIQVELQDPYNGLLNVMSVVEGPMTGASLTTVSAGVVYQINAVGTTTLAQWQARGLPVGLVPSVGDVFVCNSSGALGGTGTVRAMAASGVDAIELLSDNANLQRENSPVNGGAIIILAARNAGTLTAPAAGSIVRLSLLLSNASNEPMSL